MATFFRRTLSQVASKPTLQIALPRRPIRTFHAQPARRANGYGRSYGQQKPNLLYRWASSPTFYYQIGGAGAAAGGVYIYNLEQVPVSGRRRFNIVTDEMVMAGAKDSYRQILQQFQGRILPQSHQAHRQVEAVMERLIPHVRLPDGAPPVEWKVHVVAADEPNAFVLPGGKVFVMTGILPICRGQDGLAAVLGHEIAHNVAGHVAEKMSKSMIYSALSMVLSMGAFALGLPYSPSLASSAIEYGLAMPNGRAQESEADYIGLLIMAEACYDPHAAVAMWDRMDKLEKASGNQTLPFMSTHPASHDRMTAIEGWLPKAEKKREEGGCQTVSRYSDVFAKTYKSYT